MTGAFREIIARRRTDNRTECESSDSSISGSSSLERSITPIKRNPHKGRKAGASGSPRGDGKPAICWAEVPRGPRRARALSVGGFPAPGSRPGGPTHEQADPIWTGSGRGVKHY